MRYMRRWFRQKRKIRWKNLPGLGDDAVEEMEKKVHQVMEQIHKLPDLERLADVGSKRNSKTGIRWAFWMKMRF